MNFILMTAENTTASTVGTICGVVVLLALLVYVYMRTKSNQKAESKLNEFFDGLADTFKKIIIEDIERVDLSNFHSIEMLQIEMLNKLYDELWDYTMGCMTKLHSTDDVLYAVVKKVISKDKLMAYVTIIYESAPVQEKLASILEAAFKKSNESLLEEEEKRTAEAANYEAGLVDCKPVPELDPTCASGNEDGLNPQKDEGEPLSTEDESVEVLEESADSAKTVMEAISKDEDEA